MSGLTETRVRLQYHPGQLEVARSDARFKVLSCGRRWGKTRLAVMESLRVALDGGRVWWLAPTYQMAMEGWRPLTQMCAIDPDAKVNRSDHRVDFGKGSIEVRSADDPDKLRGAGLDLVVLDEAAFMKLDDVWDALRPALTDRQGKAIIISTPKGIDTPFHEMWQTSRDGWKSWQFPTSSNPHIDPNEILAAREDIGSLLYSQEYLAEFIQAGGGMFKADWFRYYRPVIKDGLLWLVYGDDEWVDYRECERFCTVDLAASMKEQADYTVIASIAVFQGKMFVLDVERKRMEGPDIVPAIRREMEEHDLRVAHIEHVGFQLSLIQEARRDGLAVVELRADRDKVARALPLAARLEAGDVLFPRDAGWLSELERELLSFPEVAHDDQVDALAYAAQAIARQPGRRKRLDGWVPERRTGKWTP